MTARPLGSGVSRHRDDQAVTVTTIYRLAARKGRSLILIQRDAVILIQRGGLHAVGGELMQLLDDYTGQTQPVPLKILGHKQRKNPNGQYRDYHQCQIACDITGEA